jgi:mannitol/fructose-specific phosphotransferase system IIA component (Ntr-type)/transcriptional regulator with XRE-family HTH domain
MFGQTLRVLRMTAGISLREMARKLRVSPAYLCQVEKGNRPPPTHEHIEHIASILGVSKSILQEMIKRPDPAILDKLRKTPELARFIHAASDEGLDKNDFQNLRQVLNHLGASGFRKLLQYGLSHQTDFQQEATNDLRQTKTTYEQYQEILRTSFQNGLIFHNLKHRNKSGLISYLLKKICRIHQELDADSLYQKIMQRENEISSGLGNAAAVPHLLADEIQAPILALGRIPHGLAFDSIDQKPVRIVSLILDNTQNVEFHLNFLAAVAGKIQQPGFIKELMQAESKEKIFELFTESVNLSLQSRPQVVL